VASCRPVLSPVPGGPSTGNPSYAAPVAGRSAIRDEVVRWCATANGSVALREGFLDRLARKVSFDGAFFATADPATLLYTSAVRRDMPVAASPAFIRTELHDEDVNQLRDLVRARSPVGWLDAATHGDRLSSIRYREAMAPYGLGDEMRVALRVDGLCWGMLCLHRAEATAGFDRQDAALLHALAPHLAAALRRAVLIDRASVDSAGQSPGVAVVAPDHTIEAATPAAARWLAELSELDTPTTARIPTVVLSVVERLDASLRLPAVDSPPARALVRAPSGRWLEIHAAALSGGDDGRIAVVIEPAAAGALAPLVVAAYGLTARETTVVQRLLAGLARKEISRELGISLHTVNDHVKVIFGKTGVSSVGQLRAEIYAEHFAPRPPQPPKRI
jgi:DNA-binding CsgD family transcriptional regulator